jgi:Hedgehog amino-terminal signalling domain
MPTLKLKLKQKVPNTTEAAASGAFKGAIKRGTSAFGNLVRNDNPNILFKSEEANKDDDRMMTPKLNEKVNALAELVMAEFPGIKLRVTEAWDDSVDLHARTSRHLEGRAADLTTSDRDGHKLGRLAGPAVEAGFDWVFFEDRRHVHASVKR